MMKLKEDSPFNVVMITFITYASKTGSKAIIRDL